MSLGKAIIFRENEQRCNLFCFFLLVGEPTCSHLQVYQVHKISGLTEHNIFEGQKATS